MPTLCFTGMERSEEAKLKVLFSDANEWLGGQWHLVAEPQAHVLIVDLESIYGHMTWLKVHNSGKYVIAITARAESDAEHVIVRPVTVESLVAALSQVSGSAVKAHPPTSAAQAMSTARDAGAQQPNRDVQAPRASAAGAAPAAQPGTSQNPQGRPPEQIPARPSQPAPTMREEMLAKAVPPALRRDAQEPPASARPNPPQEPQARPTQASAPQPPAQKPQQPAPASPGAMQNAQQRPLPNPTVSRPSATGQQPAVRPAAPARPRNPGFADYLQIGALSVPSCMELAGSPPIVINPQSDTYFGAQTLKPYIRYCQLGSVHENEWRTVAADEFVILKATYGEPQPLSRLRWLFSLVQGAGELAPGYDPNSKFRLTRWPKTEREFPRHLRIATTMMQGPGTPAEIATKSDTPLPDVNDFINASLESGFAELHNGPPSGPDSGAKSGGLLDRLRGKR